MLLHKNKTAETHLSDTLTSLALKNNNYWPQAVSGIRPKNHSQ